VSGGGKTTVIGKLLEYMEDLRLSVSHTTRKPRPGESEGLDYHFTSVQSFDQMIEEGLFLEWAQVYGYKYGTSRSAVDDITGIGLDALLDIDVQGAMQVKGAREDAILIFLAPPGEEEQERRLRRRGTESKDDVGKRLEAAMRELAFAEEYDYCVMNDDLNEAVHAVSCIIRAERCRNR
jgi:guanylate kinase